MASGFGSKNSRMSNTSNSSHQSNNQSQAQQELDPTILIGCANLLDEIDSKCKLYSAKYTHDQSKPTMLINITTLCFFF